MLGFIGFWAFGLNLLDLKKSHIGGFWGFMSFKLLEWALLDTVHIK